MILVTTVGKVGTEAARLLVGHGEAVRVLIRNPARHGALTRVGVKAVPGDLSDRASIDTVLKEFRQHVETGRRCAPSR